LSENMNETAVQRNAPVGQLKIDRNVVKLIFLSLITLGIYPLVLFSGISSDINIVASRYDGKNTMHYCLLVFVINPITLGIAFFVWSHNLGARIKKELRRRNIVYSFGAGDFWLWYILGSLILIGPFVYFHKLLKSMNLLCADYNVNG